MKDDPGSYAVFTEQGSSASQMTAAKVMDIISRLPGCAGQAADAVSANTQLMSWRAWCRRPALSGLLTITPKKKGWKLCRDEKVEVEWINWTCTVTGAACHGFPNIYPEGACTTLYSDEYDGDGGGLLHTGHPYCVADLVRSPCGPCSGLAGEEQSTALRSLGNGWTAYEYIECEACLPGKYRSEGGFGVEPHCSLCGAGSHASSSGATACDKCLVEQPRLRAQSSVSCVILEPTPCRMEPARA